MQLLMTVTLGSGRITDVNDLIANTLGGVLGFLLLKQVSRIVPIDQFFHRDARSTR